MSILTQAEQTRQAAQGNAIRRTYRSREELAIRDALEAWCRRRWPYARIVHELVMGNGSVRADMAAISLHHFSVFEIKGPYDDTSRLMHQICTYRLAAPDVWLVTAEDHDFDGELMRHLLPSIGHIRAHGVDRHGTRRAAEEANVTLEVIAEPSDFQLIPKAILSLLWASELAAECKRARLLSFAPSRIPTCKASIDALLTLSEDDLLAAVCRQLRGREALWRADPPIIEAVRSHA